MAVARKVAVINDVSVALPSFSFPGMPIGFIVCDTTGQNWQLTASTATVDHTTTEKVIGNPQLRWLTYSGGGGGGAPTTATYFTKSPDGTLSNEIAWSTLGGPALAKFAADGTPSAAVAGIDYSPFAVPLLPLNSARSAPCQTMMCLGDSITESGASGSQSSGTGAAISAMQGIGNDGTECYASDLYRILQENGVFLTTTAFKGGVARTSPNMPTGQLKSEGHNGFFLTATFGSAGTSLNNQFPGYWAANPADMIILMAGVNDLNAGATGAQAATEWLTLMTTINSTAPGIPVLWCTPPGMSAVFAKIDAFNTAVLAKALPVGMRVGFCNAGGVVRGDGVSGLGFDTLHPCWFGYRYIAGIMARGLFAMAAAGT